MKLFALLLVFVSFAATSIISSHASAQAGSPEWLRARGGNPNPIDHYPDRDMPGHRPPPDYAIISTTCAPEVLEGNVAATERTLNTLAASKDFAQASDFRAALASVKGTADQKVSKYFALIGVDASNKAAVAEFIGARDVRSQWLSTLEHKTGLTSQQADTVARSIQTSLRGSLQ